VHSDTNMSRPRSVVIRRYDPAPISVGVFFAVGMVVIWAADLADLSEWAGMAAVLGFLVVCFLMGPAAYVKVDASEVVVANTLVCTRIPRDAIREVAGWDWLEVVVYTLDGRRIPVGALQSWLTAKSARNYRRRARLLEQALEEVPAVAVGGVLRRQVRYCNFLLALVALLALGASLGSVL
jgi:hypothetical protein